MRPLIGYESLIHSAGDQLAISDIPCPLCGPDRRSPANRKRKVLRVWRTEPGFITYACARCGAHGYARANQSEASDAVVLRVERRPKHLTDANEKREKAGWLWSIRQPIRGTPAEIYLREARQYRGPLSGTLGFLPSRTAHPPAMIAAFGVVEENRPGVISISNAALTGVHLTRLTPDGRQKAGTGADKIMVGAPLGSPIVLAAMNDLNGLAITEGIEDGLSVHEATGLGVWAAGAASFLPALAAAVSDWIECITVLVDDDDAGRHNAYALADRLEHRGFEVRLIAPAEAVGDAA